MKTEQTDQEKTIVIDIKLTKVVVALSCVLTVVALLAYLTLTGKSAVAAETETAGETSLAASTGMRQFYLTTSGHEGGTASTACVAGYHMASLWEIADPSNLKYNTSLGFVSDDSGQGPPAGWGGWVRTGYVSDGSVAAGCGNCLHWTSSSGGNDGSFADLTVDWTAGDQDVGVWAVSTWPCDEGPQVWCIED